MKSLLFSPGSWCTQDLVSTFQEFLFPPVLWNFCDQTPWLSKSDSLGSPIARPRVGKPDVGLRTFTPENFYGIIIFQFVRYAGIRFDFIMVTPSLPFYCGFFFVFRCRVSFW